MAPLFPRHDGSLTHFESAEAINAAYAQMRMSHVPSISGAPETIIAWRDRELKRFFDNQRNANRCADCG
jgi:hypothetical protein